MRLFAIFCHIAALYYCAMAIQTMRTGVATPMRGDTSILHRKDDPNSSYGKFLFARWLLAGGLVATGFVMSSVAGKFEKLEDEPPQK